ncbi:hypothetical protein FRC09_010157 [Ceratobasidium sp. 395]|nr:hypothetical protein FRC09_010157 [Ceratobasidium sp. 395]
MSVTVPGDNAGDKSRPFWLVPFANQSLLLNESAACCTIPPAVSDYVPKGITEVIEGTPTYVIGDRSSKKAIVVTPDVFGTVPLTQQAGLLHSSNRRNTCS